MITKFLSNKLNINILSILIIYLILFIFYEANTTTREMVLLFLLLSFNNTLMYIRGMSRVISDELYKNDRR